MRPPCFFLLAATSLLSLGEYATAQVTLPLWPKLAASESAVKEIDTTNEKSDLIAGKRVARITGVTNPTITVYPAPEGSGNGMGVIVFPGGGYRILAYDLEGTEVCEWLNSIHVACLLVKYRVPDAGPFPQHREDLADAQRAVRLARMHAADWKLDPNRIGVLGFSAGGHLAAVLSNHADEKTYEAEDEMDHLSARPDFAVLIYPGGLVHSPNLQQLSPEVVATPGAPPTFLVQAENDPVHAENSVDYYLSLKQAKVQAEMHLFAQGGHGYGLRATGKPIAKWPLLAAEWFHTIGMLGAR